MSHLKQILPQGMRARDVIFVCVGTDRSTGDSLGPLVGTELKRKRYKVVGTIDDPVHAGNLEETLAKLPKDRVVIAIDACLGKSSSVGKVTAHHGSLHPGAGVGKDLPKVGDYHIKGIVNVGGFMEYFVLQNTRLSLVMKLRDTIVNMISEALPRNGKQTRKCSKHG